MWNLPNNLNKKREPDLDQNQLPMLIRGRAILGNHVYGLPIRLLWESCQVVHGIGRNAGHPLATDHLYFLHKTKGESTGYKIAE